MKPTLLIACTLVAILASCSTAPVHSGDDRSFASARTVLETNCVHCHGDNRLSTMPPINDTHALAKLIGNHWIVPGKPQSSRFFQVVTFPDQAPGAMPPTGHAISKKDVETLRAWIQSGAALPKTNTALKPVGPTPRSI